MPTRAKSKTDGVSLCRVRVARGGEEIEAEGSPEFVREMLAYFNVKPSAGGTSAAAPKPARGTKKEGANRTVELGKALSIGEFVRQLGFKRHTDLVLGFGYYLEKNRDVSEFTAADVNNCYYESKMDASNTSQMIIQNIKRGFMMDGKSKAKGRRTYTLTRSGEEHVEAALASAEK